MRFLEGAGLARHARARRATRCSACCATAPRRRQIALVCPSRRPLAGAARDRAHRQRACPTRSRAASGSGRRRSATRCSPRSASRGVAASRRDLFAFLRSPYSGLAARARRLPRGAPARPRRAAPSVEERVVASARAAAAASLDEVRGAPNARRGRAGARPGDAARRLRARGAAGRARPRGSTCAPTRRSRRLLASSRAGASSAASSTREDVLAALERLPVRLASAPGEAGRVAVLDLLRARTRRFEVVFVLGLEEGSFPRRAHASPFLDDDARRALDERSRARLVRPEPVARDRYLFYTACTRPSRRLYLVREAATDDGAPREPRARSGTRRGRSSTPADVARWTRRRPLSALTWPLERRADRARAPARAGAPWPPTRSGGAEALAAANGWERRLQRARTAFDRPTRADAARPCSPSSPGGRPSTSPSSRRSRLLVDLVRRAADRRRARSTPRSTRSCAARSPTRRSTASSRACRRSSAPSGSRPARLDDALALPARVPRRGARAACAWSSPTSSAASCEGQLWRDLERFVRDEAEAELAARPAPLRGLVRHRALGARAAARARPRRLRALREDRPHRRRPVQRARDRLGLQVGQDGLLGGEDRLRAAPADPAVHARAARPGRDRAARRPLPGARRRAARRAGSCAPTRARTASRASSATTTSTRTRSGGRSSRRDASTRAASSSGSAPATSATTRAATPLPGLVRPLRRCAG